MWCLCMGPHKHLDGSRVSLSCVDQNHFTLVIHQHFLHAVAGGGAAHGPKRALPGLHRIFALQQLSDQGGIRGIHVYSDMHLQSVNDTLPSCIFSLSMTHFLHAVAAPPSPAINSRTVTLLSAQRIALETLPICHGFASRTTASSHCRACAALYALVLQLAGGLFV
jgi:hypothetical protein